MNEKDEYLVYIKSDQTRFYYKNKNLHREAGPAIVIPMDLAEYTNLSDEDLYVKIIEPVDESKKLPPSPYGFTGIFNGNSPTYYLTSNYFLNNIHYSKSNFYAMLFKEQMDRELSNKNETPSEIVKV